MQSSDDERPISVREQVEKLKSGSPGTGADEEMWGAKEKRRASSPWMLWAILGLVIPVVLVGLILLSKNGNAPSSGGNSGTGLDFDTLSGAGKVEPQDWFVDNSGEAYSRGFEILETMSQKDLAMEDVVPFVRSSAQAELLLALIQKGEWSGFDTRDRTRIRWSYGSSGDAGFMTLEGIRKDFREFRAYFVRDESEILLDVEATQSMSDIPVGELTGESLVGGSLVRCWIAKEPHFDARSDESLFSWYQILGPNKVDFVWAYCKRGDPLDELLRQKLNFGRLIGERKSYIRATVRLGNARGFRDDEFLFEEFLADEWVLPTAQ
ncbi:MAG: hypothetical protein ACSHYB_03170 [Roseibacillus sp.]